MLIWKDLVKSSHENELNLQLAEESGNIIGALVYASLIVHDADILITNLFKRFGLYDERNETVKQLLEIKRINSEKILQYQKLLFQVNASGGLTAIQWS